MPGMALPPVYTDTPIFSTPGFTMSAEMTDTTTQETWADWFSGEEDASALLSRDSFLERLQARNIEAKESDLRYWEYEGILPRPILRWDPEVKARRAYYPVWAMAAVFALRALQHEGRQLRDMGPILRAASEEAAAQFNRLLPVWKQEENNETGTPRDELAEVLVILSAMDSVSNAIFRSEVVPALLNYIRVSERFNTAFEVPERQDTLKVDIIFTDVDGKETHSGFVVPDSQGGYRQRRSHHHSSDESDITNDSRHKW